MKLKNHSFSSSNVQDTLQTLFKELYSDTLIEYSKDPRYPFCCDVYIPRFDLFIEINGYWTHGNHPFDPNNASDIRTLQQIQERQDYYRDAQNKLKKNTYYIAENVWTKSDPLKLKYAIDNHLNYLVLYNPTMRNIQLFKIIEFEKFSSGINIIDLNNEYEKYKNDID